MPITAQAQLADHPGYIKGRLDGYEKGKQDGILKGKEDAAAAIDAVSFAQPEPQPELDDSEILLINSSSEINAQLIQIVWKKHQLDQLLSDYYKQPVTLVKEHIECLKNTYKSCIWKLNIWVHKEVQPLILKVIKANQNVRDKSFVELNMYEKARHIFENLMPNIHLMCDIQDDKWIFMEFVKPVEGQVSFHPQYFDNIIPSLAKMHSVTYHERFYFHEQVFMPWLPIYHATPNMIERKERMKETIVLLKIARKNPKLKDLVAPYYDQLILLLLRGPHQFPQLHEAGSCITHNDLQMGNIGCNDLPDQGPWPIKYLDWEGAEFKPCWLDLANLVGVFLSYRSDWRAEEEEIIARCAQLYAAEMKKYDIRFAEDPLHLYKMAESQRLLELGLYQHLRWALDNDYKGVLLKTSIPKVLKFCGELGVI